MKKKLISMCFALLLLLLPYSIRADEEITLMIDGEVIQSDVPLFIKNDRTMVPVRFIGEKLNMKVSFEDGMFPDTKMAVLEGKNGRKIFADEIIISSSDGIMYNSGDPSKDPGMIIKGDRSFVPVRYIANALHMEVTWDAATKTVELKKNEKEQEYPLFFTRDKLDKDGNATEKEKIVAKEFSIVYYEGQYLFVAKGNKDYKKDKNTISNYVDYIYSDEFPYANQKNFEHFYNLEVTLYGNNHFIMNPEGTEIVGISAS